MKKAILVLTLFLSLLVVGISVKADNPNVDIDVTTIFGNDDVVNTKVSQGYGKRVKVDLVGHPDYDFNFWIVNGVVKEDYQEDFNFLATSNLKLQAVYSPKGKIAVIFIDSNGSVIDTQFINKGENAVNPVDKGITLPDKPKMKIASTPWKTSKGLTSLENIQNSTVFVLQYEVKDDTIYTINYNTGSGASSEEYFINDVATLVAEESVDGKPFSHWVDKYGQVLSTKRTYKFTVLGDATVNAVFADDAVATPVVNMSHAIQLRDGYKSYVGQFELPEGAVFLEGGFVYSRSSMNLTLDSLGAKIAYLRNYDSITHEFLISFPENNHNSIRAFVTYKVSDNDDAEIKTIYSDYNEKKFNSTEEVAYETDFETGFNTGSTYNTSVTTGPSDRQWSFYYGTPSTTDPIGGKISAQMRWYTSSPSNLGYAAMNFDLENITEVSFYAASTENLNVKVSYSTDKGKTWLDVGTLQLTNSSTKYNIGFDTPINGRIKFSVTLPETNPTATSRLYIDDVKIIKEIVYNDLHEIIYNVDGEKTIEFVEDGKDLTYIPEKMGYKFEGWFIGDDKIQNANQSLEVVAKWSEITVHTINFESNGGNTINSISINDGNKLNKPTDPVKDGFNFVGWYTDVALTQEYNFDDIVSSSFTLYAKWIEITGPSFEAVTYDFSKEKANSNTPFEKLDSWEYKGVSQYTYGGTAFRSNNDSLTTKDDFGTISGKIDFSIKAGGNSGTQTMTIRAFNAEGVMVEEKTIECSSISNEAAGLALAEQKVTFDNVNNNITKFQIIMVTKSKNTILYKVVIAPAA